MASNRRSVAERFPARFVIPIGGSAVLAVEVLGETGTRRLNGDGPSVIRPTGGGACPVRASPSTTRDPETGFALVGIYRVPVPAFRCCRFRLAQ